MFDVVYFINNLEGYALETFDNLSEALKFCEKEHDCRIYSYKQGVPIAWNIYLYFN